MKSQMWNAVQQNIGKFQRLFGGKNFIVVDNNDAGEDIFEGLETMHGVGQKESW